MLGASSCKSPWAHTCSTARAHRDENQNRDSTPQGRLCKPLGHVSSCSSKNAKPSTCPTLMTTESVYRGGKSLLLNRSPLLRLRHRSSLEEGSQSVGVCFLQHEVLTRHGACETWISSGMAEAYGTVGTVRAWIWCWPWAGCQLAEVIHVWAFGYSGDVSSPATAGLAAPSCGFLWLRPTPVVFICVARLFLMLDQLFGWTQKVLERSSNSVLPQVSSFVCSPWHTFVGILVVTFVSTQLNASTFPTARHDHPDGFEFDCARPVFCGRCSERVWAKNIQSCALVLVDGAAQQCQ
eukprot:6255689-Amphidinium_carterae.1